MKRDRKPPGPTGPRVTPHDDSEPLSVHRDWFMQARVRMTKCPCCLRSTQIYRRNISPTMIKNWRLISEEQKGDEWVNLPDLLEKHGICKSGRFGGDTIKGQFWGLLESLKSEHPITESKRSGYCRLTEAGRLFLENKLRVKKYRYVYDEEPIHPSVFMTPEQVVRDALITILCSEVKRGDDFNLPRAMTP